MSRQERGAKKATGKKTPPILFAYSARRRKGKDRENDRDIHLKKSSKGKLKVLSRSRKDEGKCNSVIFPRICMTSPRCHR